MKKRLLLSTAILSLSATMAWAQVLNKSAGQLYDIALNGMPVTVDGDLSDWMDAQFLFLSQDKVNFLDPDGRPIQGTPESPADFSGDFGMNMDADNVYFALKVHDEGTPMIETPATPNLAFVYDHLSVYLGLYDIGDLASSPHVEIAQFYDPVTEDTIESNIRTYRIAPGVDDQTSTLGPDFQMLIRAIPYADGTTGDDVQTYNGALVDTTIQNTEAASDVFVDSQGGTGYTLEWRVPFASLAGKISKPSREYSNFEWPLFEPMHNMVIPFDADITDLDEGESTSGGATRFLRLGNIPALWRDSKGFGMRGRIVDLAQQPSDIPAKKYYIDLKDDQGITVDGDLSEWLDAAWAGLSQDKVNFLDPDGRPIQGTPESPADFSGYFAMKMDANNVYYAVKVHDEGTPMIETPATSNLAFVYDHLSAYMGLYDIGNLPGSPHQEIAVFYDPVTEDTISSNIRTYRIAPGVDDQASTLGPDFQMLLRAIPYADGTTGDAVQTYNGALVDTTIQNTEAASDVYVDSQGGTGYTLEWRVPFTSLAGSISKPSREYSNFEWPLFKPLHGMVIPFDADITDLDEGQSTSGGATRFLRLGNLPALWRDSKSFGMRGAVIEMGSPVGVFVEDPGADGELPREMLLEQNYPNPFNPTTNIAFRLPETATVRLSVFNMLGQEVAVLIDGAVPAGRTEVQFDATGLSSGMYLYRLDTHAKVEVRKMVLLK
jgi:hypothetical protein